MLGRRAANELSRWFRRGSEQIRGRIYLSRRKLSQAYRVAHKLSGQSTRKVFEGSWVPVPVGACAFSFPWTYSIGKIVNKQRIVCDSIPGSRDNTNLTYLKFQKCSESGSSRSCRRAYVFPRLLPSQTSKPASARRNARL